MTTESYTAGATAATYTSLAFTAGDLNSLANTGGALSTGTIVNGTNGDQFIDISFVVAVGGTTTSSSTIMVYLLPLNQDGSTYGDGYASSSSTQPAIGYQVGYINAKIGVTSTNTITGTVSFGNLGLHTYKVAFGNNLGVALYSTAALTLEYLTYNNKFA
jgi:hypothetical protein